MILSLSLTSNSYGFKIKKEKQDYSVDFVMLTDGEKIYSLGYLFRDRNLGSLRVFINDAG